VYLTFESPDYKPLSWWRKALKIKIGAHVRVKKGVMDPDFDTFLIGGYSGRVFQMDEHPEAPLVGIEWDKQTLSKIPKTMRNLCKNEDLDHKRMYLLPDELEIISSGV
jgi:hypothetical protein